MIWLFVRSVSDKVFHDKEYQTLLNVENMTDINALVSMVYKLFDKTSVCWYFYSPRDRNLL